MKRRIRSTTLILACCSIGLLGFPTGCGDASSSSTAIRFVDIYDASSFANETSSRAVEIPRTEWAFDGSIPSDADTLEATYGWAADQVTGFGVQDGSLAGTSKSGFPLVYVERTQVVQGNEVLHSIELKLRVSAGKNPVDPFFWRG